ncbi:MAG: GIY-YIG nuclease family protein [Labilithrix sp.]|nr:GIY-YIG nuclease family protein [Labilithrix sp.]
MREEEKAREEIARARAQAEREGAAKQKALDKAREELAASMATEAQHKKLEALVSRLENELKDTLDRKAKAIARAQLTKSGYVYVLSNIGSFGEGVYKIGLTRRLDPYERVDELGDASVPFCFDVHAIIYAEDAPGLENALHREFADRRVNRVNLRKEYFRVTLEEIQAAVKQHHGLVTMVLDAEAEEWRKTQSQLSSAAATN